MKVAWDEALSVGAAVIDDQHKRIFDNYEAFSTACTEGHGAERLKDLLWILGSYVATHFANEERLMQRIGVSRLSYSLRTAHGIYWQGRRAHETFAEEGAAKEIMATVDAAIKKWLVEHIFVMDRAIGRFMRELKESQLVMLARSCNI